MPFTERDGHRIHYRVQGSPDLPPLLLIMGLGLSSDAWDTLPAKLSPFFQVIVFDNRGCGKSGVSKRPYRMGTLADDAAAVLDACGVRQADVFGISMGGMIAQELALRHPERVRKLALGCTFSSWARSYWPHPSVGHGLARAVTRKRPDVKEIARFLVSEGFMSSPQAELAFARWRQGANSGRARWVVLQLLAIGLHSTRSRLGQIRAPTLILHGDADRLVDVREAYVLRDRIPGARLHILHGAGHVFPLEREEEMGRELLLHFLGAVPADARERAERAGGSIPHAAAAPHA